MKIGITDSGIGGLTVAAELRRCLPGADLLYLGDTARNPYGSRPQSEIAMLATELANWLNTRDADLIVLACNTITFAAEDTVRNAMEIPVFGMSSTIDLAADEASVAILATPATIATHAHRNYVKANFPDSKVKEIPCEGLAAAIERGQAERVEELISLYAAELHDVDLAVWACTHYPLAAANWHRAAPHCRWLNPAEHTARMVAEYTGELPGTGHGEFYFTGKTKPEKIVRELFGDDIIIENTEI